VGGAGAPSSADPGLGFLVLEVSRRFVVVELVAEEGWLEGVASASREAVSQRLDCHVHGRNRSRSSKVWPGRPPDLPMSEHSV
jgi:hypothetical protein